MSKKKDRPGKGKGAPIEPGMSQRDIAATGLLSRRQIQEWTSIAAIPDDVFEELLQGEQKPTSTMLAEIGRRYKRGDANPARHRAGLPSKRKVKRIVCPHCGNAFDTL